MLFVIIGHIFNLNQDLSHKNTEMQTIGGDNYHFFFTHGRFIEKSIWCFKEVF